MTQLYSIMCNDSDFTWEVMQVWADHDIAAIGIAMEEWYRTTGMRLGIATTFAEPLNFD